jgi:hypothetical protein
MKRVITVAAAALIAGGAGAGVTSAFASTPSPAPAVGQPADPPVLAEGLYGETVVKDDDGAIKTFVWQSGQVTAASGSSVTVRSENGTTWTWTLNGDTAVRKNDKDAKPSDIATGDKVRISGERSGNTRTASRVADPPPDFKKIRERMRDLRKDLPRFGDGLPGLPKPPA